MIGIIGAMEVEIETIKKAVSNLTEEKKGIRTFYKGIINNKEIVIVIAGIGKVNAAVTTSILIEQYHPEYIINIGVAGGQKVVQHKDVVISTEVLHHDVNVTAFGSKYVHGQVPGLAPTFLADEALIQKTMKVMKNFHIPYHLGKIASGDQFVTSKETIKEINRIYDDVFAIEMEAAAIAQTATIYEVPFIIYRSISDILDDKNQGEDFETFVQVASINATRVLEELLREL